LMLLTLTILTSSILYAQDSTHARTLQQVQVTGIKTVRGVGHMPEFKDGIIYAGKKSEVIIVDSLDANKAINNTRQILGRIPGLNIVETESSGFTANGIATRGLNPTQSIEMNVRQNGYNISADVYGYNESYYIPPMEGVQRIEMVRGAAALQFGAQFGGLVNYVTGEISQKPFEFATSQTLGSFGMYNTFNSVSGTFKKLKYYGFLQYRNLDGYRPNSQQWQLSGFGKVQYEVTPKLSLSAEYSLLQNRIQMPGGLTDSEFYANPKASTRARNWLKSPWNIVSASLNYKPSEKTTISFISTYIFSSRSLVWRNEDGGPQAQDTVDPATNQFVPREVGREFMHSTSNEFRLSTNYRLGARTSTLAAGFRAAYARFKRQGGGEGTTGSDFDLSITGDWGYNLNFTTANLAPFAENIFRLGDRFTVTPGIRFEYIYSTASGYKETEGVRQAPDEKRTRTFPLAGIGTELKTSGSTSLYANISQAYRPIDYAQLEPFGVAAKIDPNLKDQTGYNSDLGYRGAVRSFLNFDLGLFYLAYNNRIGEVIRKDAASGQDFAYRTNAGNSAHKGVEAYIEFNLLKFLNERSSYGLSVFNSFAYTDAKYTSGEFKGHRVEAASKVINRAGVIFNSRFFSSTFQVNYTGDAYGDAANVKVSSNPIAGYIPAYTVLDLSASYRLRHFGLKAGINNLADKAYFTRRTDEYPGPGIIPAVGRSFYVGFTARFD